jgi:virulence factor Mce-like protein
MLKKLHWDHLPRFDSLRSRRRLGVFVVVLGVALIIVVTTRPNPFRDSNTVRVTFDNVQGLGSIDRNVRVGGVNVGTIGKVKRVGDDAVVELELDPAIEVHRDAVAALRPHTLFEGSDYVDLQPGSPSAPLLGGDTIPRAQTRVYVSLDQALRVLRRTNRAKLRDLIHSGALILDAGAVKGIRETLRAAPELTKDLGPTARALQGPHGTELAGAVSGMARTVRAVASREADLAPLIRRTNTTATALAADGGAPLDATLAALPGALQQLVDGGPQLTGLIDRIDRAAVGLRPVARELAPTLRAGRPFLRRLTPVAEGATPLVRDLRTVMRRAAGAARPLRRLLTTLRPGARIFAKSVLPFLESEGPLGASYSEQILSAFGAGTGALRQYQTIEQNPNGAGHALRAGLYGDPASFPGGLAVPTCATVALISPAVAASLQSAGLCQP